MEEIQNAIDTFDRLRKYQYTITIENGMEIMLRFERERYHHLQDFSTWQTCRILPIPARSKKSCLYDEIRERIESFGMIEEILAPGEGKIIVEFDNSKTDSVIRAKFHLYRREGDPFKREAVFFTLFIDCENSSKYYPVTYVVERSNMYVREQTLYDCTIERQLIGGKKILVGVWPIRW